MAVRGRVLEALGKVGGSNARAERYGRCGSDAVVEFSPSQQRHRVRANYCGDRFCHACQRSRAAIAERKMIRMVGKLPCRFLTLTLAADGKTLLDRLDRLHASFSKLRRQKFWTRIITGGVAVTEITLNEETGNWHVHLHVLAVGGWIDWRDLRAGWFEATGDSTHIHIQRVQDQERAVGYVASYAGKGFDGSCLENVDRIVEMLISLKGRRLFATFGRWHGLEVAEEQEAAKDWKRVGRLVRVIEQAVGGASWASAVLRSLRRMDVVEHFIPGDSG